MSLIETEADAKTIVDADSWSSVEGINTILARDPNNAGVKYWTRSPENIALELEQDILGKFEYTSLRQDRICYVLFRDNSKSDVWALMLIRRGPLWKAIVDISEYGEDVRAIYIKLMNEVQDDFTAKDLDAIVEETLEQMHNKNNQP